MLATRLAPLLLVACVAAPTSAAQEARDEFEGHNLRTERDPALPGNPVVKVAFGCHSNAPDADLARLSRFPELRELAVLSDRISDAGIEHLKALPCLETLRLNSSTITDAGVERVAALPKLKTLVLFRTRATAAGLAHLRRMTSLRELHLCRLPIDTEVVAVLKELTKLEKLGFAQLRPESREKAAELIALLPRTRVTLPPP